MLSTVTRFATTDTIPPADDMQYTRVSWSALEDSRFTAIGRRPGLSERAGCRSLTDKPMIPWTVYQIYLRLALSENLNSVIRLGGDNCQIVVMRSRQGNAMSGV